MKIILRIMLAPLTLVSYVIECVCRLALMLSSVVSVLLSILFVLAGICHYTNGAARNGCIGLVIAFLLSPYGLPMLAVKLAAWFIFWAAKTKSAGAILSFRTVFLLRIAGR